MRMLRTTRRLPTEVVQLERSTGLDGQGAPSYASAIEFDANVLEYDAARGEQFVILPDGSRVDTPLTLYIRGDETAVPDVADRITLVSGVQFIVMERTVVSGLRSSRSEPDHYRLRCKVA